jgi:YtkA-like
VTFYMPAMPTMGMAAMKAQSSLTEEGDGTYVGTINLQIGGTWQVTIIGTKDGQTLAVKRSDISVSGPM